MANTPAELNYDMQEVIDFCKNSSTTGALADLAKDLNTLVNKLNTAESHFHCKGGSDTNALIEIYNGFSDAIGESVSNNENSGSGVARVNEYCRSLFQTCFDEAFEDKKALESYQGIQGL